MLFDNSTSSDHQTFYTPVDANPEEQVSLLGFEGPEKLIEIWFKPPQEKINEFNGENYEENDTRGLGLRVVQKEVWDDMLTVVRAQILSITSNESQDAYLLSESSMFVSPYRFMIKTCGTTTLLNAVPKILEIAKQYCGLDTISAFFYSRKCFMFPDRQERPHKSWDDEVKFLEATFPECKFNTSAYVVGKLNRDHWNLYMATPYEKELLEYTDSIAELPQEQFEQKIQTIIRTKKELNQIKVDKDGIAEDDLTLEIYHKCKPGNYSIEFAGVAGDPKYDQLDKYSEQIWSYPKNSNISEKDKYPIKFYIIYNNNKIKYIYNYNNTIIINYYISIYIYILINLIIV